MQNTNWDSLSNDELTALALKLKKEKNCIILAHNYQCTEVQKIADYVGDSLQMAKVAAKTDAKMILLCGIRIMAETAKALNQEKRVLLSHAQARCPLAEMKKVEELRELKSKHPEAEVVCYVNSTTDLKAESTITCTSGNVAQVINALPKDKEIIFVPDNNIGDWASYQTGRKLKMWDGYCYVHNAITLDEVLLTKEKHPDYTLLVHPECKLEICKIADHVCSTGQMIEFIKGHDKIIVGTEIGLFHQMAEKYPEKQLVPLSNKMNCIDMQKTTLKTAVKTLVTERNEIFLSKKTSEKANESLARMLEYV
jgi:quinolinate synthase